MMSILSKKNNYIIVQRLDDGTLDFVMETLLKLPAEEFKEINPDAHFDFTDLPIPIEILSKSETEKGARFSPEIEKEFSKLLADINTEGKNREYPYAFGAKKDGPFDKMKRMPLGESQTCQYDWKWIEQELISQNLVDDAIIFHTHPKPIGKPHDTLYTKYPEILGEMGVKPDGLNLSMSDLIVNMRMDQLIKQSGHDMTAQSYVLMHDGNLVGFSTANGVKLEEQREVKMQKETNTEIQL